MKKIVAKLSLFFVSLMVISWHVMAPALGSESISGAVTDGTNPIQNATVQAWQNNLKLQETTTASDGSYTLSALAAGIYIVRVHKEEFYAKYLDNQPAPSSEANIALESLPSVTPGPVCDFWCQDGATYSGDLPPIQIGDVVTATDPDGVICGVTTVGESGTDEGDFFIHVYGDDPTTPGVDEGAVEGDTIILKLNTYDIENVNPQPVWQQGGSIQLTLVEFDRSLPVRLSALTATWIDDQIIIRWRTETEVNNIGFSIYRSEEKDGNYTKIGGVSGAGNSAMPIDYQFTDKKVEQGKTYFYHLQDIDITGENSKSKIIKVVVPPAKPVPKEFRLLQNYPNPFNPDTWIPFQLAQDAPVIIHIYNTKGQLTRTLHLGNQNAGVYVAKDKAAYWDGRDNLGQEVASGVYYYTLRTGNFTATRKMVILK